MEWVRRNALGIAVTYFVAAPFVVQLTDPGDNLVGVTVRLLVVWIVGFPLFWLLRRFARSN